MSTAQHSARKHTHAGIHAVPNVLKLLAITESPVGDCLSVNGEVLSFFYLMKFSKFPRVQQLEVFPLALFLASIFDPSLNKLINKLIMCWAMC